MTTNSRCEAEMAAIYRVGAVSFLNAKPLVAGLLADPCVDVHFAVPAKLADLLTDGRVDAALIPVVDLAARERLSLISDACIASDGETLTVRVFSRIAPSRMSRLRVDGDSHTSVLLARLIWLEMFDRAVPTMPLEFASPGEVEDGVLLIGDKVVSQRPRGFAFEVDLGAAWRELTGLPFVYAVWAADKQRELADLPDRLERSRDMGVRDAAAIADREGPRAGWPVEIARRYLTETMHYRLTRRHRQGMELFLRLARDRGLLTPSEPA